MTQTLPSSQLHREAEEVPRNPPPSRQDIESSGLDLLDITQRLEKRLLKVSEILEAICTVKDMPEIGLRRVETVQENGEDEGFRRSVLAGEAESRAASPSIELCLQPDRQRLQWRQKPQQNFDAIHNPSRPVNATPNRPCGRRRSSKSGGHPDLHDTAYHIEELEGSILGSVCKRQRRAVSLATSLSASISPPAPCKSPPASHAFACNLYDEESRAATATALSDYLPSLTVPQTIASEDNVDVLKDFWTWNESRRCSTPLDHQPEANPPAAGRSRKSSLLSRLNRSQTLPRPPAIRLGPIERPFPAAEASPAYSEPRSKMDWDWSDDEENSLAVRFRRSLGKGSFKAPRLKGMLRRNSSE